MLVTVIMSSWTKQMLTSFLLVPGIFVGISGDVIPADSNQINFMDMGSYHHGLQANLDSNNLKSFEGASTTMAPETVISNPLSNPSSEESVEKCVTVGEERITVFYKRLVSSIMQQLNVMTFAWINRVVVFIGKNRELSPGETFISDVRAELSHKDLEALKKFVKDPKVSTHKDAEPFQVVDAILTSLMKVQQPPRYLQFKEFLHLQLRKLTSAEAFNVFIVIFFAVVFFKLFSFLFLATTTMQLLRVMGGFVVTATIFVIVLQSQGYVVWQSLPTEAVSQIFATMGFKYVEAIVNGVTDSICKDSYLLSHLSPFVKILVWLIMFVYSVFVFTVGVLSLVFMFVVSQLFRTRIRTWFVTIEPYNPPPPPSLTPSPVQQIRQPEVTPSIVHVPSCTNCTQRVLKPSLSGKGNYSGTPSLDEGKPKTIIVRNSTTQTESQDSETRQKFVHDGSGDGPLSPQDEDKENRLRQRLTAKTSLKDCTTNT